MDDVEVPPELSAAALWNECKRVAALTPGNRSSMLADLQKGNKVTEIDHLNGYLMTLANRCGEEVKLNASLVDLIKLRSHIPLDTMI